MTRVWRLCCCGHVLCIAWFVARMLFGGAIIAVYEWSDLIVLCGDGFRLTCEVVQRSCTSCQCVLGRSDA